MNYVPMTRAQKQPRVRATAPETSRRAAVVAMMREGSLRKTMFHLFQIRGERGYTDDELEIELGKSHQSVSACRNGLVADGLVRDSGARRVTRYGNEAIVWVVAR